MDSQTLVIAKEERLVLANRTADGAPELVLLKLRLVRIKELPGVEGAVAQKLEGRSMDFVGTGPGDDVHHSSTGGKFTIIVADLNLELGDALESRKHFDGANRLVPVVQAINHKGVEAPA